MDEPKIITIQERKLAGLKIRTSLSENRTFELWNKFKPLVKEITHRKNSDFYSIQIFEEELEFNQFNPQTFFEKWAAVEVESLDDIPDGLETFTLPAGKYALFIHHGPARTFPKTSQYIFGKWLPVSGFEVDNRPHFEVMAENYKPDHPNAEEEVWIPIQKKDA